MIRKLKQRINLFLKPMIHYYANFMYWIRKQTLKVKQVTGKYRTLAPDKIGITYNVPRRSKPTGNDF